MKQAALFVALFAISAEAFAQLDPNAARDAKLIAEVKAVSVHKLDEALPDTGLEKWLRDQSGDEAKYHWEVNDCGEQSGTPGDTGPVPLCVEVASALKDGRQIVIFIANDQPKDDTPPDWKIFFAQLVTPHEKITLRRLSELPAALIRTH
jgi:hypothetical protein